MDKKAEMKEAVKEYWNNNKKQIIRTGAIVLGAICGLAIVSIVAATVAEHNNAETEGLNLLEEPVNETAPFEADQPAEIVN